MNEPRVIQSWAGALCIQRGNWWGRIGRNGWGLALRDHRLLGPLFSERYSGNGTSWNVFIHAGPWCATILRPVKRRG